MRWVYFLVMAVPLAVAEPEETTWYDAEGQVVAVEPAGTKSAEIPFVAEWRKREIDRREAKGGPWSSEIRPVRSRSGRHYYASPYWGYGGYSAGIRVNGRHFGGYYRSCPSGRRGGASVIIHW
jgi:hypothetical protein